MNTIEFLDAAKARLGITSDYALGKKLGWGQTRLSQYRTRNREMDDDGCLQIAAVLELPPEYVMACVAAARAKSAEAKSAWQKAADLLKTGTAAVILGAALLLSQNAPTTSTGEQSLSNQRSIHYARLRRALARFARGRRRRRILPNVTADNANDPALGNAPHGG